MTSQYQGSIDRLRPSTADIPINRPELVDRDRRLNDQEDQLISAKREVLSLCSYIQLLERQLARFYNLNPGAYPSAEDGLEDKLGENVTEDEKTRMLELADLMKNSSLIKHYEGLIQQFEADFEVKSACISDMKREVDQIRVENSHLAQQLYHFKTQTLDKGGSSLDSGPDAHSKLIRDERDHLMELMKRNHDIVVEKYEVQRQRNDSLEKLAIEKERLYNEIKIENDQISNNNYKLQRAIEELLNEKRILEGKYKNADAQLRQAQDELRFTRVAMEKAETTCKVVGEQLENAKRALEEVSVKKQQEVDMLSKELQSLTIQARDAKQRAYQLEAQGAESRDELRQVTQELEGRSRENDHLVSLLEEQEQRMALYEQKERGVQQLAVESKKRLEEANQERDKVLLKEQQYLRQIARLEDRLKEEGQTRQDRNEKLLESLRLKHKATLETLNDEISDLRLKLSDAKEAADKHRVERDSARLEVDKIQDQLRSLKEEAGQRYEQYSRKIGQSESVMEEKLRSVNHDNERLAEENETLRKQNQQIQLTLHEHQVKLDSYTRDYERYFDETKRLRELQSALRDDKDAALSEVRRLKTLYHDRINELNDECNLKLAQLENQLLETRERAKFSEEKSFEVMRMQERIVEKWKSEHHQTVDHYEKTLKAVKAECRHLQDKVIELKGTLKMEKENNDDNLYEKMRKTTSSKSKEREKAKKAK